MRFPSPGRASSTLLIAVATFAAGVAAAHFGPHEARAQESALPSTIYVPGGGIVFRALDGSPLARLSRDPSGGGALELYDERHEVSVRLGKTNHNQKWARDEAPDPRLAKPLQRLDHFDVGF